jgi:hypothetical protein
MDTELFWIWFVHKTTTILLWAARYFIWEQGNFVIDFEKDTSLTTFFFI